MVKRLMKRYNPMYEQRRGPYAQVRSFIVHGKRGYYRKPFTMKRRGKIIHVRRTFIPPTRKVWRVRSHKKRVWYLPGQVTKRRG